MSRTVRCERGHLMRANPTPGQGRPEFVHRWPQDLAECVLPPTEPDVEEGA